MQSLAAPLDATNRPLVRQLNWREHAHQLLFRPSSSLSGRRLQLLTNALILLSTVCFVLESIPSLTEWGAWEVIDAIVAVVFTVEYAVRILVAPDGRGEETADATAPPPSSACEARLRCAREPLVIIDLLAISGFWLEVMLGFMPVGFLQILRTLRLVRVLRLLRLAQESRELRELASCVRRVLPALRLLLFFLTLELLVVGGLVFHAERGELVGDRWVNDDGSDSTFQNILEAAWWTLVTVTTVGYGDFVPVSALGRLIASCAMLTGVVGLSAIISIVGAEMAQTRIGGSGDNKPPATKPSVALDPLVAVSDGASAAASTAAAPTADADAVRRLEERLERLEQLLLELRPKAEPVGHNNSR